MGEHFLACYRETAEAARENEVNCLTTFSQNGAIANVSCAGYSVEKLPRDFELAEFSWTPGNRRDTRSGHCALVEGFRMQPEEVTRGLDDLSDGRNRNQGS